MKHYTVVVDGSAVQEAETCHPQRKTDEESPWNFLMRSQ